MPLLLDTNAAVWAAHGKLPRAVQASLTQAAHDGEILLSPITAWEVAMLVTKRRLKINRPVSTFIHELFNEEGVVLAPITPRIGMEAALLPPAFPSDPADRILAATAIQFSARLVTADTAIIRYAKQTRAFECIKC